MMQERRVVTVASFMIDGFVIFCVMEDKFILDMTLQWTIEFVAVAVGCGASEE